MTLNKEKTILFKKINKIFTECNIKFILFNRSLLYAEKLNLLSPDLKDDLITDLPIKDRKKLIESLRRFYKIKISKDKIEFNAKKIKINIYFFNSKDIYFCFKGFLIKTELFKKLNKISIQKLNFFIPKKTETVLKKILFPSKKEILSSAIKNNDFNFIERIKNLAICLGCLFYYRKSSAYEFADNVQNLQNLNFNNIYKIIKKKIKKKKLLKIDYSTFKNLYFDKDEFNLIFRKKHYSIIGYNRIMKIKDILRFIKINKINLLKRKIKDTDTSKKFEEPIYFNKDFWQRGNNFFVNSLIYGFKKNLLGYEKINSYILINKKPNIYSQQYYESLDNMTDTEIKDFLEKNPLPIRNQSFISGRHRVAAMIGRIIKKKKYIPFYIYQI